MKGKNKMTTSTNTLPMSIYLQMVQSKEYEEATLRSFNHGEQIGVEDFKRKIKSRIEYWTASINTKKRTIENEKALGNWHYIEKLKQLIEMYESKIEELQFLMGE